MTFLLAYRSRPNALRSFLTTLAATTSDYPVQLVIVDLGSTAGETAAVIADHKGHLHVDYHWINYRGIFYKSKALNFGLSQIDTELVTIVDVDALFKHDIVAEIDNFFSDEKNRAKKIGWQVRHIDPQLSSKIMDDPSVFNEINLQRFRHHNEIIDGVILGNSHMTIQRQLLLDVGGFDERYVGWGFEDVDLNQRLRAAGIETIINQTAPIYHLSHRYEQSWKSDESDKATKTLYLSNKAKGFPAIPITADWGHFGGCP